MHKAVTTLAIAALLVLVLQAPVMADVRYQITDLGTLGGDRSMAMAINDLGQIVGESSTGSSSHAFLYSHGTMTDLYSLQGQGGESIAYGINNLAQVVGQSSVPGGHHAFLYTGTQMTDIDTLQTPWSIARAINDNGQITGEYSPAGGQKAFRYQNGVMEGLGTLLLPGVYGSAGNAIDRNGRVFGYTNDSGGSPHMAMFDNGSWTLMGPDGMYIDTDVFDVNDNGTVVGVCEGGSYGQHGIVWSGGYVTHLGVLSIAAGGSTANAINNQGQIVGSSPGEDGLARAVIYENTQPIDLNSLIPSDSGWTLEYASDINNLGQIVGYGISPDSMERAFLLTPVPEPASLWLLACGGLALLGRGRHQPK